MKSIKFKIFIIILIFSIFGLKDETYAYQLKESDKWTLCQVEYKEDEGISEQTVLDIVNEYISNPYEKYTSYDGGNPLTSRIVVHTNIICAQDGSGGYNIIIGGHRVDSTNLGLNGVPSLNDLYTRLGGPSDTTIQQWDATFVASVPYVGQGGKDKTYTIKVIEAYNGLVYGIDTGVPVQIGNPPEIDEKEEMEIENKPKFEDGLGQLLDMLLYVLRLVLGDGPQIIANSLQSGLHGIGFLPTDDELSTDASVSGNAGDFSSQDDLVDPSAGVVNNYINFKEGKDEGDKDHQIFKEIPEGIEPTTVIDGSEQMTMFNFSSAETEIPLISTDLFSLAANKVSYIDANFFEVTGKKFETWKTFRNLIASFVHGVMYVAIGCMIMALIYNGAIMVKGSITENTVTATQESREGLQRLFKGFILLIGTIFIEALCIYSNEIVLGKLVDTNNTSLEGPIRVYVAATDYSFSTTPTGYYRYMSEIKNEELLGTKALYTIGYVLLAIGNLLFLLIMFVRMIAMMGIAIISFGFVIYYLFSKNEITALEQYKSCMVVYIALTLIQVLLAIVVKIVIDVGMS